MDDRNFDALIRKLTAGESRRRLLGLASTSLGGGLSRLIELEETEGKGRRKRRKKRHKHGSGRRRNHDKPQKKCTPDSTAQTCAGKCGTIPNNCKTPVDCGSCACDPLCGECFVCQEGPYIPRRLCGRSGGSRATPCG